MYMLYYSKNDDKLYLKNSVKYQDSDIELYTSSYIGYLQYALEGHVQYIASIVGRYINTLHVNKLYRLFEPRRLKVSQFAASTATTW